MDVVIYIYLKHSPDYIDSKYIWVHRLNSLGSSVFAEIPFLAFSTLHRKWKRCSQVLPHPCYSQSEVVYAYQVLDLQLQGFFWPKIAFFAFVTMVTIFGIFFFFFFFFFFSPFFKLGQDLSSCQLSEKSTHKFG